MRMNYFWFIQIVNKRSSSIIFLNSNNQVLYLFIFIFFGNIKSSFNMLSSDILYKAVLIHLIINNKLLNNSYTYRDHCFILFWSSQLNLTNSLMFELKSVLNRPGELVNERQQQIWSTSLFINRFSLNQTFQRRGINP
jgi:hypothetical protein